MAEAPNYMTVDQAGDFVNLAMTVGGSKLEILSVDPQDALRFAILVLEAGYRAMNHKRYGPPREQK